jgi:hypothetical protein
MEQLREKFVSAIELKGVHKTIRMYLQFQKRVSVTKSKLILNRRLLLLLLLLLLLEKTCMDFVSEEKSSCVAGLLMVCLDSELQLIFIRNVA